MVEKAVKDMLEEFRVIPFVKLAMYLEASQISEKYVIIFDKTEQADKYFQYKATLKDFHSEIMNVKLGMKTKEEALEVLRRGIVYSMKIGDNFVINTGKLLVDWENEWTDPNLFPIDVFNREEWRERDRFIQIVTEEENVGLEGEKNAYDMREKWNLVIIGQYTSDEELMLATKRIPNWDEYAKFIVQDGSLLTPEQQAIADKQKQMGVGESEKEEGITSKNIESFKNYSVGY